MMEPEGAVQIKFTELAQLICRHADTQAPGWSSLNAQFAEVNGERILSVNILFAAAESTTLSNIDPIGDLYSELRELMADPLNGAWFSSRITIGKAGDVDVKFDHHDRPRFDPPLHTDDYLEDLQRFPRTAELPYWHPAALSTIGL